MNSEGNLELRSKLHKLNLKVLHLQSCLIDLVTLASEVDAEKAKAILDRIAEDVLKKD